MTEPPREFPRSRLDPHSARALDTALLDMTWPPGSRPALSLRRAALEQGAARERRRVPGHPGVRSTDRMLSRDEGSPSVPVRVYQPAFPAGLAGAILFMHGGGYIMGSLDTEDVLAEALCAELGAVVVSVGYRLAPESPYPAALDDCMHALRWFADHAGSLGADAGCLTLVGGSAGGGLALACALRARDEGGPPLAFVLAAYPMIDDACETISSQEIVSLGVWDRTDNLEAWDWYLAGNLEDPYAAPARATSLSGLPPTFLDVGDADAFRDETITFAGRLLAAGVATELHVYRGAFHASEEFAPTAPLSRLIIALRMRALRAGLRLTVSTATGPQT